VPQFVFTPAYCLFILSLLLSFVLNGFFLSIGFIVGTVLTSTLMTLISSAVNTVIVCYAEAPAEFQTNHPKLSEEMRSTWRQAWPAEFSY